MHYVTFALFLSPGLGLLIYFNNSKPKSYIFGNHKGPNKPLNMGTGKVSVNK